MLTENVGPLARSELDVLVAHISSLQARAVEHDQHGYALVLELASLSLADNIEQVDSGDFDDCF